MSSNYPPGVSGREPQISGEWPCANCGAVLPEEADCPGCGKPLEWRGDEWECANCTKRIPGDVCPGGCYEPDWDAEAERRAESRWQERNEPW